MWHITSIHATNLCSFVELNYVPKQGAATLIFGENLDSDSQNSNGSGKSALVEAIAIGLTGEPLRKVNIDEIINDSKNEATISLTLSNSSTGEVMTVNRCLSRKQPQRVQIIKQNGPYDTDTEEIRQASVGDYNKYILEQIGLTKDDIFANFILTARKYKSFLSSSDKDKKEIINRFSNGILVDESIDKLREDIEPVQCDLEHADKDVAVCTGRVEALDAEIEKAVNESAELKATNESRIQNWEKLIADKRYAIRTISDNITTIEDSLDALYSLDTEMQDIEKADSSIDESLRVINEQFKANNLALTTDFAHTIAVHQSRMQDIQQEAKEVAKAAKEMRSSLVKAEAEHDKTNMVLQRKMQNNETNIVGCNERLQKLAKTVKHLQNKNEQLTIEQRAKNKQKVELENKLAGVIQCPKCKYEFTLGVKLDIESARKDLSAIEKDISRIANELLANENQYNKAVCEGKNQREIETALNNERYQIAKDISKADELVAKVRRECDLYERKAQEIEKMIAETQSQQLKMRKSIFDEAFEILDSAYKRRESQIKSLEDDKKTLEGSIQSYEKAIDEARKATSEGLLDSLKKSRTQYQEELETSRTKRNSIKSRFDELSAQEATFVEFKTYLANTKINAIAQITNEFLEAIGSDIRVALSGYTILKSGKVRDKISVSLLRDGVDCGSFEKFSAGERVRVELASILSMNQLMNLNCEDGKGLDLLIADEVLDSADEQGLASVFKALNKTQITSLVISHGQVHEGYPNKIIVVKSNGVSSIYENNSTNQ